LRTSLAKAERDLSFTVIRAPFDGVLGNRAVQTGDYVEPGQRFASLVPLSWWRTYLISDWDFWELVWPQIFRGVGLMTAIISINNVALGTLPPERVKNASGLYNLTRNLGGAFGLAGLTTVLNDRTDLHLARLHERLTFASRPAVEALNDFATQLNSHGNDAKSMALQQLMAITHAQGVVMAFADVFFLLALLFVALAAFAIVVKKPAAPRPG
jgi:DHA2 family multidrug resistance protein